MATGDALDASTWYDFVERLLYHCNGAGVKWHHSAAVIFTVQTKRIDYAEGRVVCQEGRSWFSPKEYWVDLDEEEGAEIDQALMADRECGFMDLDDDGQGNISPSSITAPSPNGTSAGRS
ncbi:hypothetical protein [Pseudomonas sp. DR 5-09]|uniref:hypothetical protein n=1 Tax=Pseudomonas sp. DR 5-09 TaxID=1534110 RepID=UPI0007DD3116|nr:hypothetical protein [Pseudomonas sp. DR 5-09]ANI54387.1 hypothetical protein PDR5_26570 [Pseudomonas sp. DR 5-09]